MNAPTRTTAPPATCGADRCSPSSTQASTVAITASRQATTPATCGDSRRTDSTPVMYATTVATSTIQASSATAGTAVPFRCAEPASTDQSMLQGRATTV